MNLSSASLGFYSQTMVKKILEPEIIYTNSCLKHLIFFLLYLQSKKLFKISLGVY